MAKNPERRESLASNKKHTFKNSKVVESLKETFSNDERIGEKVIKLIKTNQRDAIEFLTRKGKTNKKMALYLINAGEGNFVCDFSERFNGLDSDVVLSMFEHGLGRELITFHRRDKKTGEYFLIYPLSCCEGVDYGKFIDKMVNFGEWKKVLEEVRLFKGVDHNLIVNKVIDTVNLDVESNLVSLIRRLHRCKGLKREIADKLFSKTPFESPWRSELIEVLGSFDINSVNPQLAYNLFMLPPYLNSSVEPYNFYKNLDKFYGLDYDKLVCMGITSGWKEEIKSNFEYFNKGLSQETLDKLK